MRDSVTKEGMAVLGGWWLSTLWAHVALPEPLPFAAVLLVLGGAATLLLGRRTLTRRAPPAERSGCAHRTPRRMPRRTLRPRTGEPGGLAAMRATLRGLEAELYALEDQRMTELLRSGAETGRDANQTTCGAGR